MGTSPPIICGSLGGLIWICSGRAFCIKDFFRHTWFWPFLLIMALPLTGLLYTPDFKGLGIQYAEKTHYWIYTLAIAYVSLGSLTVTDPKKNISEKYIWAFLAGLAVNTFVGVLQYAGTLPMVEGRWYCGLHRGYSTLTAYLVLGILITSYYFKSTGDKKIRLFLLSLMMFYFFHLNILEGRAGYLTFIMLSPLIVCNIFNKFNIFKILIVCSLIAGLLSFSPIVRERISLSVEQVNYHLKADPDVAWGREYSDKQDRFYMWYGAIHIFLDNPVIGIGTGGYQKELKQRGKPDDPLIAHPHNDFLYMAVSFGIIGIIAFIWFFTEMIKNAWKHRHTPPGYFVLSTALVMLAGGLFNTYLLDSGTLILLAVVAGLQHGLAESQGNYGHE
ncbi:MAG: O-antigen ligase family protein [Desulfobacterales bacterium]|nr:O-antigen ligase family protein [Desulfobacterales bacterium]